MKKLTLLFILIILSCGRDLEVKSGEKYISKMYFSPNNYFSFNYKNKQLTNIIYKNENRSTDINIEYKNNIPYIITLNSLNVDYTAILNYNNGKLVQVEKKYSDNSKIITKFLYNSENKVKEIISNDGNTDIEIVNFKYQLNTINSSNSRDLLNYTINYDDKKSPFYNIDEGIIFAVFVVQGEIFPEYINTRNNIIKSITQNGISQYNKYQYLDDLPIEKIEEKESIITKYEYINL